MIPEDSHPEGSPEQTIIKLAAILEDLINSGKSEFVARVVTTLQLDYIELARLATEDQYDLQWTHIKLMDFLTKGEF